MDAFFEDNPQVVSPVGTTSKKGFRTPPRIKVGSLQQLKDFRRVSQDTLVHKSTNDLWALVKEGEDYHITRLFQDNGQPLKG